MSHWNLVVVSYTFFILCQSLESQKSRNLNQPDKKWPNQSLYFGREPEWPERILKKQNPLYSLWSQSLQKKVQPKKQQVPEWPDRVLQYNNTKQLQNHTPWSPHTLQPFGLITHKISTTKMMMIKESGANFIPENGDSHYLRSQKRKPPHKQGYYRSVPEHDKPSTKDIIKANMDNTRMGIEGDAGSESRVFDATDADFVSFLMMQADDMAEAMTDMFATRRVPHYFTVHHTRCLGVATYCIEACLQVEKYICQRFKCSRQVKEYVTKQCQKCNVRFIRNFPRNLLLSLDFLKAREVYSKITNRTFESFFPPKYLKPFYSNNQPSYNKTADYSYYSSNSSEYYSYYASGEYPNTTTTTTSTSTTKKIIKKWIRRTTTKTAKKKKGKKEKDKKEKDKKEKEKKGKDKKKD